MDTIAIYNRYGEVVGWLKNFVVYDVSLQYRAVICNNLAINYKNSHIIGRFDIGYFRDKSGYAIGFTVGATNGPKLPKLQYCRPPEMLNIPSITIHIPSIVPAIPMSRTKWSSKDWDEFLNS